MGNGMNKVMPSLYIGNYRDSKDVAQLDKYNITHILSIHDAAKRVYPEKHYLCITASDTPSQNLSQYFSLCNDFIHAARLRDGVVLIHCLAGMSRSVTVAVAYIMSVTNLSWKDALKVVRVGRAVANPNSGFKKQLQEFENTKLAEERKRLGERFPSLALCDLDDHHCQLTLQKYQKLLIAKHLCEFNNCPKGELCSSGICKLQHRKVFRKNSVCSRKYVESPSTSQTRHDSLRRPHSGPSALMNNFIAHKIASEQNLPDLNMTEKPKVMSAPPTPRRSQVQLPSVPFVD